MLINFILNITSVLYILLGEYSWFVWSNNYQLLIHNIIHRISKINICYVKLFQACASNKYLDDTINRELLLFTDNVPYTSDDIDHYTIKKIQEHCHIQLFSSDQFIIPIKSGTISLIFLDTTSKYIIKIKRLHIDAYVENAISDLRAFIILSSFFPYLRKFNIEKTITINITKLREQLNYQTEIENTLLFQTIANKVDYLLVPTIYPEITQSIPNVIMMDYMVGYRIEEIEEADQVIFSKIILKITFYGLLHRLFHGDLHSGNILFCKNNGKHQIILLDFGIIMKYTNQFSDILSIIMSNIRDGSVEELSLAFLQGLVEMDMNNALHDKLYKTHITHLTNILSIIITDIKVSIKQFNILKMVDCIIQLISYIEENQLTSKYGIVVKEDTHNFCMSIIMCSSIILKLCNTDLFQLVNSVFCEMFQVDLFD